MDNLHNFCEFAFVYGISAFAMMTMMHSFLSDDLDDRPVMVWTVLTFTPMLNTIFAILFLMVVAFEYIMGRMLRL